MTMQADGLVVLTPAMRREPRHLRAAWAGVLLQVDERRRERAQIQALRAAQSKCVSVAGASRWERGAR